MSWHQWSHFFAFVVPSCFRPLMCENSHFNPPMTRNINWRKFYDLEYLLEVMDVLLKIDWLMAHTNVASSLVTLMHTSCLVMNVCSVSGRWKNIGSLNRHIYSPGPPALSAHLPCWPACLVSPTSQPYPACLTQLALPGLPYPPALLSLPYPACLTQPALPSLPYPAALSVPATRSLASLKVDFL